MIYWIYRNIAPFFLVISIIVFVHEWGHFFFARLFKIPVATFSVGFGPTLLSFKDSKGTTWQIAAIPLGGYVKMLPQSKVSEESNGEIGTAPPLQKLLVALAGPLMNFIFAFLSFAVIFSVWGILEISPTIKNVHENSSAFKSGILKNDTILEIDGKPFKTNILKMLEKKQGKTLPIKIQREEKIIDVDINLQDANGAPLPKIGIEFSTQLEKISIPQSIGLAFSQTLEVSKAILLSILGIFKSENSENIGGILTIGQMAKTTLQTGLYSFLAFMALLSINLGVINLLPIPMLDGGHMTLYAYELIRGKAVDPAFYRKFILIGFFFLLSIMTLSMWNDLSRIGDFGYITKKVRNLINLLGL